MALPTAWPLSLPLEAPLRLRHSCCLATLDVSTETRKLYLEVADKHSALADAEGLSTLGLENVH